MIYYLAVKQDKTMQFAMPWMNSKDIMLREFSMKFFEFQIISEGNVPI